MASGFDILGGAMSGAELGSAAGPWGTAIGAVAGGLYGAFAKKPKPKYLSDPNQGLIDSQIYQLLNSHLGTDLGNRAASRAGRQTQLEMESIGNRPGMTNAAALGQLYDDAQRHGEGNVIDAQLAGAQHDQQARMQALGLLTQDSQKKLQLQEYNNGLDQQPSALETIGMQGLGMMVGQGMSDGGPFAGIADLFKSPKAKPLGDFSLGRPDAGFPNGGTNVPDLFQHIPDLANFNS